jgi:hypothetical protein
MAMGFGFCASCGTAATGPGEKFCASCGAALPAQAAAATAVPPPYGQAPYGQAPYGQAPYGQPPYGQPPYGQPPYGQPPYGQPPYAPVGPARSQVNPLLVILGVVIIAAIVVVGALALSSKGSPASSGGSSPSAAGSGGGTGVHYPGALVFSPNSVGCDAPMTITFTLPASVTETDLITLRVDGVDMDSHTVIDAGMTQQADGSWSSSDTITSDCSIGPGLHTEQLVDSSGTVLAEGSYTIVGSSSAKPTAKASKTPTTTPTTTPTKTPTKTPSPKPTLVSQGSMTFEPSTFSCSGAPVQITVTARLPASLSGSTLITAQIDGSVGETDTVDSAFQQQADGSWLSAGTSSSTDYCAMYSVGKHTFALLDQAGQVIVEGSFTSRP